MVSALAEVRLLSSLRRWPSLSCRQSAKLKLTHESASQADISAGLPARIGNFLRQRIQDHPHAPTVEINVWLSTTPDGKLWEAF